MRMSFPARVIFAIAETLASAATGAIIAGSAALIVGSVTESVGVGVTVFFLMAFSYVLGILLPISSRVLTVTREMHKDCGPDGCKVEEKDPQVWNGSD